MVGCWGQVFTAVCGRVQACADVCSCVRVCAKVCAGVCSCGVIEYNGIEPHLTHHARTSCPLHASHDTPHTLITPVAGSMYLNSIESCSALIAAPDVHIRAVSQLATHFRTCILAILEHGPKICDTCAASFSATITGATTQGLLAPAPPSNRLPDGSHVDSASSLKNASMTSMRA